MRLLLTPLFVALTPLPLAATPLDEIGYTQLANTLGENLPTGAGMPYTYALIEGGALPSYTPNPDHPEFLGKNFTFKTTPYAISAHATNVGVKLFGNQSSLTPDADNITVYSASDCLGSHYLRGGSANAPLVENAAVHNFSWILTPTEVTDTQAALFIRKFDYAISRDDYIAVVGINNGSSNPVPLFGAPSYNAISVGRTNGNHGAGWTDLDGEARIKPEIVAPGNATSFTTPLVGSAALLLRQAGETLWPDNPEAITSITLKALLLAGATIEEFPNWQITESRPLDIRYGAGELNIYNAYQMMAAGPTSTGELPQQGWKHASLTTDGKHVYTFTIPDGQLSEHNVFLTTWNRRIAYSGNNYSAFLANLDLRLYKDGDDAPLAQSIGTAHNIEHLRNTKLLPGNYRVEVHYIDGDSAETAYSLAFRREVYTPTEPSTYEYWSIIRFGDPSQEESQPQADPDLDGLSNLAEYALGLNPHAKDHTSILTASTNGADLLLKTPINAVATGVNITIETSADLQNWETLPTQDYTVANVADNGRDWRVFTLTDATTQTGPRFYRLKIAAE